MKFLAVLAVLAMAFAAFAVIAPAETDDATNSNVTIANTADYTLSGAQSATVKSITVTSSYEGKIDVLAEGSYIAVNAVAETTTLAITLPAATSILYIPAGKVVTINNSQDNNTIKVIPCTVSSTTITIGFGSYTLANGTSSAAIAVSDDAKTVTVSGTQIVFSEGMIPSGCTLEVGNDAKVTVSGVLTNDGRIVNNAGGTATNVSNEATTATIKVDGTSAKITATSKDAKGVISGTTTWPLVMVKNGTVEKQKVIAHSTISDNEVLTSMYTGESTDTAVFKDLELALKAEGIGIRIHSAGTTTIEDIKFSAESATETSNMIVINDKTPKLVTIQKITTSNIGPDGTHAMLAVATSGLKTAPVGTDVTGYNVAIDSSIKSVAVRHNNSVFVDNLTLDRVYINGGNLTIETGKTLSADVVFGSVHEMNLKAGSTFEGNVTYGDSSANMKLKAATVSDTGNILTVAAGSVKVNGKVGALEGSKIEQTNGSVELGNGAALEFTGGTVTLAGAITVETNGVTIDNGATVKTATGSNLTIGNGKLANNGKFDVSGTVTGTMAASTGTTVLETGADVSAANLKGTIKDNTTSSTMSELIVKGDSEDLATGTGYAFPAVQSITVNEYWNLIKNTNVTIKGELVVPEGAKLTINAGAKLTLDNNAKMYVYGTLVIDDEETGAARGELDVNYGQLFIYGTATVKGLLSNAYGGQTDTKYGVIEVSEESNVTIANTGLLTIDGTYSNLVVKAGATLKVNGAIYTDNVFNYGTIVLNSAVPAVEDSTIYMAGSGAVVDVQKFVVGTGQKKLTITDKGLVVYTSKTGGDVTKYAVGYDNTVGYGDFQTAMVKNKIEITATVGTEYFTAVTAGLKVVETVTSKDCTKNGTYGYITGISKAYTNTMSLSGDFAVGKAYIGTGTPGAYTENATISVLSGKYIAVDAESELAFGVNTTFSVASDAVVTVKGILDASDYYETDKKATYTNAGTLTLDGAGLVMSNNLIAVGDGISAAKIETGTIPTIYKYMSIDSALALAAADDSVVDILLMGEQSMTKSATLLDGVTLTLSEGAKLNIGAKSTSTGVVLTVQDDALLKGDGDITVNGTLYTENYSIIKGNTIVSDVFKQETDDKGKVVKTGWAQWTNLVSALNGAEAGDVITIYKTSDVNISGDAEIKAGVRVVVPETAGCLVLGHGVTLTVNGVLETEKDILAKKSEGTTTGFAIKAENSYTTKTSAIVVNGAILLPDTGYGDTYGVNNTHGDAACGTLKGKGAPVAGAYYATEDYRVISSIEVALANVEDIIGDITIHGDVKAGDLIFLATDDCGTIKVAPCLNDTTLPTAFTVGTIILDGSKIDLTSTSAELVNKKQATFTGTVVVGSSAVTVTGASAVQTALSSSVSFDIYDDEGKLTLAGVFTVSDKGDGISVDSGTAYVDGVTTLIDGAGYYGTLEVKAGATLESASATTGNIKTILVNGTVKVPVKTALTVVKMTLYGDVVVSPSTSTSNGGAFAVSTLFAGITAKDFGSINFATGAASVSGKFTLSTAAYVLDGTTFDAAAQEVLDGIANVSTFKVENKTWFTIYSVNAINAGLTVNKIPLENVELDGWNNGISKVATNAVVVNEITEYKAVIKENIYSVTIITDTGIKSVAIDGIEMIHSGNNYFVTDNEVLGSKLAAGVHTVSYTLYNGYEGTAQLHTADGTILKDLKFTLSGTKAENKDITLQLNGTEQIIAPEPSPVEQNEWTITTILLVILVILIAVMAVIVALRLNRS